MHRGSVPPKEGWTVPDRPRHQIIDRHMVEADLWVECRCGWVARASLAGALVAYGEHLEGARDGVGATRSHGTPRSEALRHSEV